MARRKGAIMCRRMAAICRKKALEQDDKFERARWELLALEWDQFADLKERGGEQAPTVH